MMAKPNDQEKVSGVKNGRIPGKSLENLKKAVALSFRVKSSVSHVVTIVVLLLSFLPVLLAKQFQYLTDALQRVLSGERIAGQDVWQPFILLAGFLLLQLLLDSLKGYYQEEDARNANAYVQKSILELQVSVKYKYIENYDNFLDRIHFAMEFTGSHVTKVLSEISLHLGEFLMMIFVAISLAQVNPWFVVITVLVSLPSAYITYRYQDETFENEVRQMQDSAMINHYFWICSTEEFIQEVRHFRLFPVLKKRWRATADRYIGSKSRIMKKHTLINAANDIVRNLVCLVILFQTVRMIYGNPLLGIGVFTLVLTLTRQLMQLSGNIFSGVANLISYLPYMGEYFSLMELPRDKEAEKSETSNFDADEASGISTAKGEILFEHVSFSYPGSEQEVLHDINVRIKPGEKVAIVGENGSGKTTFINLLCGFYEAEKGCIRVDGEDIYRDLPDTRNKLTVAIQNFAHYEDTLRENIVISDSKKVTDDGQITGMLRSLDSLELVNGQKEGLDTRLGSYSLDGNNLSGGQWQKLAIARAAWRDKSRIMILDEPTAALDPMAETKLYQDFSALTGGRTTLLISHRLGISTLVDRILVFSGGRIVEEGTHNELMRTNGYYAKMYRAQAEWYR